MKIEFENSIRRLSFLSRLRNIKNCLDKSLILYVNIFMNNQPVQAFKCFSSVYEAVHRQLLVSWLSNDGVIMV